MSIIRQDLSTKDWTVFAVNRSQRPNDFIKKEEKKVLPKYEPTCPFCRKNEKMTPDEMLAINKGKNWTVRVVPNKYPAVESREASGGTIDRHITGPYLSIDGVGSHEVIVESPWHNDNLVKMSLGQVEKVIKAYRQRYMELSANPDYQLIIIFKNHGRRAGTSLEHPHSQLVATPFVPGYVRNKMSESQRYFDDLGKCVYCDMIKFETKDKKRIIYKSDDFIAFAPFASVVPYNVLILPRKHQACFAEIRVEDLRSLAKAFHSILGKLYYHLNDPDYNFVIDSIPIDQAGSRHYHWHIEILPRLSTRAGFEIGSGMNINIILPENCAKYLREQKV